MSDTKWTPGPWSRCDAEAIVGESGHGWFVRVSDKRVISVEGRTEDEADANAHLIAAAPDLYQALEYAKKMLEEYETEATGESFNSLMINAALAKARGE